MSANLDEALDIDDDDDDYGVKPARRSRWRAAGLFGWFAALPSVATIGFLAFLISAPRGNVEAAYRKWTFEALGSQQYKRAAFGSERLLQLEPFNPEYRFWLASASDGVGEKRLAEDLMIALAPKDQIGFGPAHFWQAEKLLRQEPLTAAAVRDAELHLRRVDRDQMKTEPVMRLMALVMLKTNRLDEAKEYLAAADMASNPDLRVFFAEALSQNDKHADAEHELKRAIDELRERVQRLGKSTQDGGTARRSLADALVLRGDFIGAEQVLQEGVAIGPAERYAKPMGNFYSKWLHFAEPGARSSPSRASLESVAELIRRHNDGSVLSNGLLAFFYQHLGRLDDAVLVLKEAAKSQPDASFGLVGVYLRMNRPNDAKEAARSASKLLAELVAKTPEDAGLRERWAEALLLLDEFNKATSVLEEGRKFGRRPNSNAVLAKAYVAWWDAVVAGKTTYAGDRLELLKRAVEAEPWNPLVFSRLAAMKGDEGKAGRETIAGLLAKGASPPAAVHWILGNEAWSRGDHALARRHMEQANALSPNNLVVLNNFAWMLAFGSPPEPRRGLQMADEAVRLAPRMIDMRHTRGRILAKLGEWSKALADLQLCLPARKNDAEFLLALAEAYEKNGLAELGLQYRKMAGTTGTPKVPKAN